MLTKLYGANVPIFKKSNLATRTRRGFKMILLEDTVCEQFKHDRHISFLYLHT